MLPNAPIGTMETPPPPAATIRAYLNQHLSQALGEADPLPFSTVSATIAKGATITRYGQVERHAYFLNQGIVQVSLPGNGEEKILDFFLPGGFFSAYTSLLTQCAADVELVALTPCVVERIARAELLAAYETSLLANQLGRVVTEQLYLRKVKREKEFLNRTVEERYADLFTQQPALLAQLPVDKIARYLGIHPNSLSRIRRKVQLHAAPDSGR